MCSWKVLKLGWQSVYIGIPVTYIYPFNLGGKNKGKEHDKKRKGEKETRIRVLIYKVIDWDENLMDSTVEVQDWDDTIHSFCEQDLFIKELSITHHCNSF